jgi:DNA polymerase elongation subunit (family B)
MGLESKNPHSHAEYRRRFRRGEDLTDYVRYCVQDCEVLRQMNLKRQLIAKKLMFIREDALPLEWALYATTAHCIQFVLVRRLKEAGLEVNYEKRESDMQRPGAYTYNDPRVQGCVLDGLSDGDYESEYPNTLISRNLSWETISECEIDDPEASYVITDTSSKPIAAIKISDQPGILT